MKEENIFKCRHRRKQQLNAHLNKQMACCKIICQQSWVGRKRSSLIATQTA